MPNDLARARLAVRDLLVRVRRAVPDSAKETLVQALCEGLRAIPVPLVGTFLARLVENSADPYSHGPDTADLLRQLEEMTGSDQEFTAGLERLGENVERLLDDLQEIRRTQVKSEFRLARFVVEPGWPIEDHHITGLLLNSGGGLVTVDELFIEVERAEPVIRADLSVPAAPLVEIHLKATLDARTRSYPLFSLNNEGGHQFQAGMGAERLVIDLDSRNNLAYDVRLRVPYTDLEADQDRQLLWPAAGDPAVRLEYPWAPGWRHDMELIDADAVFDAAQARLEALTRWLERREDHGALADMGVPDYMAFPPLLASLARAVRERSTPSPSPGLIRAADALKSAADAASPELR